MKAVILSSGGLDSTTVMAIVADQGCEMYSLTFDYGQRHLWELKAAERVAAAFKVKEHKIIRVDLRQIGGSALTDNIAVPKGRKAEEMSQHIPITYVPARNSIFLAFAMAWAEILKASYIFAGMNAQDYSGYIDCRPDFIDAFRGVAALGTEIGRESGLSIITPLMYLSKADIIRRGMELGVDYAITHSCYDPDEQGFPCHQCDSCALRAKGFSEAEYTDPLLQDIKIDRVVEEGETAYASKK